MELIKSATEIKPGDIVVRLLRPLYSEYVATDIGIICDATYMKNEFGFTTASEPIVLWTCLDDDASLPGSWAGHVPTYIVNAQKNFSGTNYPVIRFATQEEIVLAALAGISIKQSYI